MNFWSSNVKKRHQYFCFDCTFFEWQVGTLSCNCGIFWNYRDHMKWFCFASEWFPKHKLNDHVLAYEPIGGNPGSRKKLNVRRQLLLFFWRVPKIAPGPRGGCRTGLLLAWQELQTLLEQQKQCLNGARKIDLLKDSGPVWEPGFSPIGSYVKDEGINISTMTSTLTLIMSCQIL
jgi:hypothetical protein